MRCIIALALAALAVLGPLRPCAPAEGAMASLPVLHSCCPRPAADAASEPRLASACCCSIEERGPGVPAAPPAATTGSIAIALVPPSPTSAPLALAPPIRRVPAPAPPATSPPLTLYEHRSLLLS
jgi:hypothetical protein